jgi:hypothetical protein
MYLPMHDVSQISIGIGSGYHNVDSYHVINIPKFYKVLDIVCKSRIYFQDVHPFEIQPLKYAQLKLPGCSNILYHVKVLFGGVESAGVIPQPKMAPHWRCEAAE